jgi:class 3 adenylate cyclase/DNA-binding winged helix-turn-helix (wHTH) protein
MDFRVLGPLEVADSGRLLDVGGAKRRAVLAILILHANELVTADRLIDDLWGDEPPRTSEHSVQVYVSELRKLLGAGSNQELIATRPPGYVLQVDDDQVDARRFERLTSEGRRALAGDDHEAAAAKLREALSLWRGPALAEFEFEPFAQPEIARLADLRISVTEDRIEADLALGHHVELVGELQRLVGEHPLRERLRSQLLLALYRSSRQSDALQAYQDARRILGQELGIDPGPALQKLEQAILDQDPSLDLEPREAARSKEPVSTAVATVAAPGSEASAARPSETSQPELQVEQAREVRKIVSVVFADVAGSTSLGEQLDPEAMRATMTRYFDVVRKVLERNGGTVEKFIGDAVMAVFGVPNVHEDDALRAVRAANELEDAIAGLNETILEERGVSIRTRTGVNTGEVVAGGSDEGGTMVTGDAVNVAARLEASAAPGEILIGTATYRLVRDAVVVEPVEPLPVKGKSAPVEAYRLLDVKQGVPGVARRSDSPMVGRDRELAALGQTFELTSSEGACHLFTVLGAAGIGKSRLIEEFCRGVQDQATILKGRCLAYGDGITYWPIIEVIEDAAGIGAADSADQAKKKLGGFLAELDEGPALADGLSEMMGLSQATVSAGETFLAIRRLLEAMARRRPLVLVVEDIHWAEPTLLDLLESVADWSREAPIFLLCTARPEMLEGRPGWSGGKLNSTNILLAQLSDAETTLLLDNLVDIGGFPDEVRHRIMEASEGNPLFVEQMVSMLIDDGRLQLRDGAWAVAADLGTLSVPAGIQTLLAARLDRLPASERRVIERASVIGKRFDVRALEALTPEDELSAVRPSLSELVRKDLIRSDRSGPDADRFRFQHILIVNAAYDSVPKRERAALHERFAGWMGSTLGERISESEEILGYHLERAYAYRADLGPVDDDARRLRDEAGARFAAAGARAFARADMPTAVSLYSSAAALLPAEDPVRTRLLPDLGTALVEIGEMNRAEEVFAEAVEAAQQLGDLAAEAHALYYRYELRLWTLGGEASGPAVAEARRLMPIAEERGDDVTLSLCYRILQISGNRMSEAQEYADRAMFHSRRAGDRRSQLEGLQSWSALLVDGPIPVKEAIPKSDEFLELAAGDRVAKGSTLVHRAPVMAMAGRIEQARDEFSEARAMFREAGLKLWLAASGTVFPARAELLAGDPVAAEDILREGQELLRAMSATGSFMNDASLLLAAALLEQGRIDEAEEQIPEGLEWTFARHLRAMILASRGGGEEAEPILRELLDCEDPDRLSSRASMWLDLAKVQRTLGQQDEANRSAEAALALWERKGDVVSAVKARALIG